MGPAERIRIILAERARLEIADAEKKKREAEALRQTTDTNLEEERNRLFNDLVPLARSISIHDELANVGRGVLDIPHGRVYYHADNESVPGKSGVILAISGERWKLVQGRTRFMRNSPELGSYIPEYPVRSYASLGVAVERKQQDADLNAAAFFSIDTHEHPGKLRTLTGLSAAQKRLFTLSRDDLASSKESFQEQLTLLVVENTEKYQRWLKSTSINGRYGRW